MPTRSREEYFNLPLKVDESSGTIGKMFVLVIYDISDNRRRASLAKILAGFGYRVQESAFEAMLTKGQLAKLVARIDRFAIDCDNIRCVPNTPRPAGSVAVACSPLPVAAVAR